MRKIIPLIAELLRGAPDFSLVNERITARVPIVKFRHKITRLEGDISLYNNLAIVNTDLLRHYSALEERTKILGVVAKYFAKTCQIGDASRGSLSSYAYIIML